MSSFRDFAHQVLHEALYELLKAALVAQTATVAREVTGQRELDRFRQAHTHADLFAGRQEHASRDHPFEFAFARQAALPCRQVGQHRGRFDLQPAIAFDQQGRFVDSLGNVT